MGFFLAVVLSLSFVGGLRAESGVVGPEVSAAPSPSGVLCIENVGQFAPGARFQVRGGPGTVWLADDAIWVTILEEKDEVGRTKDELHPSSLVLPTSARGVNLKLSFVGANAQARLEPLDRLETKVSYFIGADAGQWHADVPVWGGVRYVDLYPGVDLVIGDVGAGFKPAPTGWRLVVREGDQGKPAPTGVRLRIEGAEGAAVEGGALRLTTALGEVSLPLLGVEGAGQASTDPASCLLLRPGAFEVAAPFAPADGEATMQGPAPQGGDPNLLYSGFLGGSAQDYVEDIAVDGAGCAYVTGFTYSSNFPTTLGAYDRTYNECDAFVAKINAAGTALVYATYIGGSDVEIARAIAVDGAGSAHITGYTDSLNFPTTSGAWDRTHDSEDEVFVTKLNTAGSALFYSTYITGDYHEEGEAIAVDGAGAIYVTGFTNSNDFPTTVGAWDRDHNTITDYDDAFVTKIVPTSSALTYSTFLGGTGFDHGYGIAVDGAGAAYVVGDTDGDFPTTTGAWDRSASGFQDVFITKLTPSGQDLTYSTYLGSTQNDIGAAIAVGPGGEAYVTGQTASDHFPTTGGDTTYNGGSYDAFVTKLSSSGGSLTYSAFLGGSLEDAAADIALDGVGSAYVAGRTTSDNFPTTSGAFDRTYSADYDIFVTRLQTSGTALGYSTYFGDTGQDKGNGIAVDGASKAYFAGYTTSSNFYTSGTAWDTVYNLGGDGYITKLHMGATAPWFGGAGLWCAAYGSGGSAGSWTSQDKYPRMVADVTGDGKADVVGFGNYGTYVSAGYTDHFGASNLYLANYGYSAGGWTSQNKYPRMLGDVNGDNRADVVAFGNAGVYVSLSSAVSFGAPALWLNNFGYSAGGWTSQDKYPRCVGDVNGDGEDDVVGFGAGGAYVALSHVTHFHAATLWLNNFGYSAGGWTSQNTYPRMVADVNADGKADAIGFGSAGAYVALSTGTSFSAPVLWIPNFGTAAGGWTTFDKYPRVLALMNNEARADVIAFGSAGAYISLSTASTFALPVLGVANYGYSAGGWTSFNTYPRFVADVNHDGKGDIVGFGVGGTYVSLGQ
jgi:hypothetical protein